MDPSKLPAIHNVAVALEGTPQAGAAGKALWSKTAGIPLEQGSTVSAKVHTLWDTDNLYVKVDVTDASQNGEDKVELFLDENNGKTTAYQPDDRKISLPRSGSGTEGVSFTSTEREGGYIIEARIPLVTVKGAAGADWVLISVSVTPVFRLLFLPTGMTEAGPRTQIPVITVFSGSLPCLIRRNR